MEETLELRVDARHADRVFAADEGVVLSTRVRRIVLPTSDPRLASIAAVQAELHARNENLLLGWRYRRRYSKAELRAAPLLTVAIPGSVHLAGDIAGTVYDAASACPVCGAGRRRLSPLRLHLGRLPWLEDIMRSATDEWIVSARFVAACEAAGATGIAFTPVEFRRGPTGAPQWYELCPTAPAVSMSAGTLCAAGAFPDPARDVEYVCPMGDTIGLHRISEVHLSLASAPETDVFPTREYVGMTRGVFTPQRELLMSNRLYWALAAANIRGLRVEIARLSS